MSVRDIVSTKRVAENPREAQRRESLKSLYEKLGVNSRRDAVRLSREQKLLDTGPDGGA